MEITHIPRTRQTFVQLLVPLRSTLRSSRIHSTPRAVKPTVTVQTSTIVLGRPPCYMGPREVGCLALLHPQIGDACEAVYWL